MYKLKIKELRKERKITQKQLSKLSRVSRSYISEVERGKHDSTVEVLVKLCLAFEISPNELLDWDNLVSNYRQ